MELSFEDISSDLRCITFSGRLDIQGTEEIAARFAALATDARRNVIVDFSGVTFLASIGIRALISNAKALRKLGGGMTLVVGADTSVARTLDATGIDVLLRIFNDRRDAEKALSGGAA